MRQKRQVFAVMRVDDFHGLEVAPEDKVTVKEVVESQQAAEREVERLTRLNREKGCRYYVQATRLVVLPEEGA